MSDPRVGWISTTLSELVGLRTGPFGSALHQSDYVRGGTPLVNPMHIINGRITPSPDMSVSAETVERLADFRLRVGDVVLGRRGEMGRCAVVGSREEGWLCGTGSLIVRPNPQTLSSDYLQKLLTSRGVVDYLLAASVGSTMANLNQQHLLALEVQLPPLTEQTRIVNKLEELLSDLDAGVAELKAAQKKLQQYRQSLLKAAVEGSLTAAWREANPQPEETGADLLARILRERRARWEAQQLAKFEAQGKVPPKGWQSKYSEPTDPETADLPELPVSWTWASVEQLAMLLSGHTPNDAGDHATSDGSIKWFKVGDMNREGNECLLIKAQAAFDPTTAEALGLKVAPVGTIVFPKRGGAIATNKKRRLGVAASYDLNMMGLVPSADVADWLWWWFSGIDLGRLSDGSNVPQINNPDIAPLPVPLPPVAEQAEIVARLAAHLESLSALDQATDVLQRQSTAQRQNLLRAAFAGQLVPQDPADEPAAELLARIRAERAQAPGKLRKARGTGKEMV